MNSLIISHIFKPIKMDDFSYFLTKRNTIYSYFGKKNKNQSRVY